jgi:hypothetical protein
MSHFWSRWTKGGSRRRQPGATRRQLFRARPMLELLEDRLSPAVFNVNSLQDLSLAPGVNPDGSIVGTTTVTLRSAIQVANMTTGGNTINLTIPGVYQITLAPTTPNESDNLAGEFAILPEGDLAITNTSGGAVTVSGNGLARVFDINPGNTDNPATHFTNTLTGFTITNGKAFDATGATPDGAVASGGGIRDQGNQSLTLNNMFITNCSATADGGGVSMENSVDTPWTLTVNGSTVSDCTAGDAGGGIDTDGSGKVFIQNGSVLNANTCVNQGAGIWLDAIGNDSANLTVTDSVVSDNKAIGGPTGGIGNAGNGAVTITNSTVAENFCGGSGGGFGDENNLGTLVVTNSTFANNSATGSGGGIQEGGPSTTINDSTITGNTATLGGGGLSVTSEAFTLNNTIVATNQAGGANFISGMVTAVTVTTGGTGYTTAPTVTFSPAPAGGTTATGVATTDGNAVTAVTITNAGAGYTTAPTITFGGPGTGAAAEATIVGPLGPDVFAAVTTGNGNFIGIGDANLTGITNGTNGNQIGTPAAPINPHLGALVNNGGNSPTEAPLPGSPVIDAGVNSFVPTVITTDQRGAPRIVGAAVDIGAVEFQNASLSVTVTPSPNPVVTGNTASFTVKVTNTSANALPADNSTVTVTLSGGLSATSPLKFSLGGLASGQSASLTVTANTPALGTQTASAVVNSPDTASSATGTGSVSVISTAPTTVTVTNVTSHYTLFTQVETVTASVTSNGKAVTVGQVTLTDGGQSQTVNVGGDGTATATFTFGLFSEQPLAHPVTAMYSGATGFASSNSTFTAPSTLFGYLFQLYFDYLILVSLGL